MNILWVQIRSWHALEAASIPRTRCGRWPASDAEVSDTLPVGKSCETCLRIVARLGDNDPVNEDVGE